MDASGTVLGAYLGTDKGAGLYAKVLGSYGWYDMDADRDIAINGFGGTAIGSSDLTQWTLGAHLGYRAMLGERAAVTPYVHLDHVATRMDGFSETGVAGASLTLADMDESRTYTTVGGRLAGDIGGVVAELDLGWRRLHGDDRTGFSAYLCDQSQCPFDVVSSAEERDSALLGLALGTKVGRADVQVAYQGLFDGARTSHAGNVRLRLPLGSAPAPVIAPPPPPPAPPARHLRPRR